MLAASVLAGFGFLRCCELLNARFRLQRLGRWCCQLGIAVLCLGLFMLELGFKPFPLVWIQTAQEVPAVYRWLATQPPSGAILELPFGHAEDYQYTYFSTYHWLPIVNGRSGFIPPTYVQLTSELNALPSQPVIHSLSAVGVRWIVVHTDRLNSDEVLSWGTKRFVDAGLEVVAEFGSDVVYKVPPVHSTAELQLKLAVPDRLPAAKQLRLGLLAAGKGSEFWTIQPPSGNTSARIEWEELSTGKISLAAQRVQLPLLIKAGNLEQIGVEVRTPSSPGEYLLRVHLPMLGNSFVSKRVGISMDAFPTSRDSPHLLAATYALEETAPGVVTSEQVELSLRVTNTGEATWLATSKRNHGAVRLGWRWFKGDHEIPSTDGRAKLRYDISPGMAYLFEPKIPTPQEPGKYSLELGLVSDHVTWFHEQGVESVKLSILVPSRP
jgi:hypothetical protein